MTSKITMLHEQFNLTSVIYLHTVKCVGSSSLSIDGTLAGTTAPCERTPVSNDNEGVLHIPQRSKIWISPSDCLMSYPGLLEMESYLSAEM